MRILFVFFSLLLATAPAQEVTVGTVEEAKKMVILQRIIVEGTRLPPFSVIRLAQIKAGDQVNFFVLYSAMQKVTNTGLISHIDFEYETLPEKETEVLLHVKCTDVKPAAKASIQIAKVNEDDVWNWLTGIDPLFTQEMPPTEAAIRLYSHWIGKYMESHSDAKFPENFAIVANASSSPAGAAPDKLIFKAAKRRGAR